MELLVIRHAIAVERVPGASEEQDATRPLTSRGRRRFEKVVRGLERIDLWCDAVLHSPARRAVETAALLEPIVRGSMKSVCRATPHLAGAPRAELLSEIVADAAERTALVGHEPWLSELVALLVGGTTQIADALPLRKGGVVWLDGAIAPAGMQLRAFLPPRVLRAVR